MGGYGDLLNLGLPKISFICKFPCLLKLPPALEKCLCRSSAHFLIRFLGFLILSYMSCLYILEINPLSVALFANIFSQSVGCLFTLFMVFFAVQKLLSLIRSHLFIFAFISVALGNVSKNILLWFMSENVLSMFSSRRFIIAGLTFRSLIHLRQDVNSRKTMCREWGLMERGYVWGFSVLSVKFFYKPKI